MLILTVAMPQEAQQLTAALEPLRDIGRRRVYGGQLACGEVLLVLTGMGMVNAAQAVTAVLEATPGATEIINLGCAGAYGSSGLAVGDVAVAQRVIHADMGVQTARRLHGLHKIGIPLAASAGGDNIYNEMTCDPVLSQRLKAAAPQAASGAFATVGRVSGDPATAEALAARWPVIIEEMEAAAVAQVAAHYDVPFAAVRGVSNIAGDRGLDVAAGAESAQRVVLAMGAQIA